MSRNSRWWSRLSGRYISLLPKIFRDQNLMWHLPICSSSWSSFLTSWSTSERKESLPEYVPTVVDIAGRFKAAEPLTSKESSEVSKAFQRIYKGPLRWPSVLQVDRGREFMGDLKKKMARNESCFAIPKDQDWNHWRSQRSRNRWTIQSNIDWTSFQFSVFSRNDHEIFWEIQGTGEDTWKHWVMKWLV